MPGKENKVHSCYQLLPSTIFNLKKYSAVWNYVADSRVENFMGRIAWWYETAFKNRYAAWDGKHVGSEE